MLPCCPVGTNDGWGEDETQIPTFPGATSEIIRTQPERNAVLKEQNGNMKKQLTFLAATHPYPLGN